MLSAFKRLTSKGDQSSSNNSDPQRPQSHQSMSVALQKKFSKGVQYNMKIVIKGDRNVGKTCLFHRLQGKQFIEEYIPTEEIQVTSIQWNYKATDDVVKVEVWDVVDKGKKKKKLDGLKMENLKTELPEEPALDAEFLDVYKGTNGVILMMDLTKSWTFDYVQRELPRIPPQIPVIVLANHCDMSHHRTITSDHVIYFIESVSGSRSSQVRYTESSMRNGFGLKLLHKFFNLPYLQLQRESLKMQLERNAIETNATVQELDIYAESDEANYAKFMENLTKKRREIADFNGKVSVQKLPPPISDSSNTTASAFKKSQSGPIVIGAGKPIPYGNVEISRKSVPKTSQSANMLSKQIQNDNPITSVEEFCPDGGQLDRNFLDDIQNQLNINVKIDENAGSDSDTDTGNPLVSEFQEDFDPNDLEVYTKKSYNFPKTEQKSNERSYEDEKHDDFEAMRHTQDEFDSTLNSEISELAFDAYEGWIGNDTRLRRSPEGGEDVSVVSQVDTFNDDSTSITSSNVQMELLSSKQSVSPNNKSSEQSGDEDTQSSLKREKKKKSNEKKSERKHKSKKKDKESKESNKEKRNSKRRSKDENSSNRDELEEFLNGTNNGSMSPKMDGVYEAI